MSTKLESVGISGGDLENSEFGIRKVSTWQPGRLPHKKEQAPVRPGRSLLRSRSRQST